MIAIAELLTFALAMALAPEPSAAIPMTADRWELQGPVVFEIRDGRKTMRLGAPVDGKRQGGQASIKDLDFATGVVEFDFLLPDVMEFSGPLFRQSAAGDGEYIYLRPHMNGKPDAIQYTPVVAGNLAWQIFTGPGFEAETRFPTGRWAHARLDVYARSATLSIDGKKVLRMPALKGGAATGGLGFAGLMGGTYYSDVSVRKVADYADPEPIEPAPPLPAGTVAHFDVSEAMTQAEAYERAAAGRWPGIPWHRIAVETNGIANLSKAGPDGEDAHSFIARFSVTSALPGLVPMSFGFSDDVRVYLNGRPLYEGSDRQGSRDYRFLGHAGLWDSVFLDLKAGKNEVALVVSDPTNGGTAAAAKFPADSGLTVD